MNQGKVQENIFYRHFDLPANFPVIGLLGDSWKDAPEPLTRMHFHNCIELGFAREGKGVFYVGKSEVPFEAPCLVIAPPNVPHGHTVQAGEECSWNWIYVDPQAMLSNLSPRLINMISEYQRDVGGEECVLSEADHPEIMMILKAIISEMEQTQVHYHHIVRELFGTLFLLLLRSYSGKTKNNLYVNSQLGCIAPAVAYIAENYMEEISVEKLSYLCHVSTSHFRRLFKTVAGLPPRQFLIRCRLELAATLLTGSPHPVGVVAELCGIGSEFYFSRLFKEKFNLSPLKYRREFPAGRGGRTNC